MECAVKCPYCGKEISLWDIAVHLEQCGGKKESKYELNDRLEIFWTDAYSNTDWQSLESANKRPKEVDCKTVGYFTKSDKDLLYISHSIGTKENTTRDVMTIPLGTIKKIQKL